MKSNFQELEINNKIVNLLYKEWKTLFEESGFHTIQQVKVYYKKHRKSIRFFVLRDNNGNIIACYSFTVRSGNLYLCDVIVAPMYRKQGFSKILIQDACMRALNEGYSNIYLNATSSLVPFYEKYSFKVISKSSDRDEYCMKKILKEQNVSYNPLFVILGTVSAITVISLIIIKCI